MTEPKCQDLGKNYFSQPNKWLGSISAKKFNRPQDRRVSLSLKRYKYHPCLWLKSVNYHHALPQDGKGLPGCLHDAYLVSMFGLGHFGTCLYWVCENILIFSQDDWKGQNWKVFVEIVYNLWCFLTFQGVLFISSLEIKCSV